MAQTNPYSLRISDELMETLKKISKENGRSVNKEIEFALKKYVQSYQAENK